MKAVMISIRPKWVEKIASGEKTVEVRKTAPKLETPFKCYIYCTNYGKTFMHGCIVEKECLFRNPDTNKIKFDYAFELECCHNKYDENNFLSGKVVGEFVCDNIYAFMQYRPDIVPKTCLSTKEMEEYLGDKDGYGWHISDLKIYDKPKELSEFHYPCTYPNNSCYNCAVEGLKPRCHYAGELERPPHSGRYVEEK